VVVNSCCMCKCDGKSVYHLLLHCPVAHEMWSILFGLFGLFWVMPRIIRGSLDYWHGKFGRHHNMRVWRVVPHCLMWCL
jgi:hypothetical protein